MALPQQRLNRVSQSLIEEVTNSAPQRIVVSEYGSNLRMYVESPKTARTILQEAKDRLQSLSYDWGEKETGSFNPETFARVEKFVNDLADIDMYYVYSVYISVTGNNDLCLLWDNDMFELGIIFRNDETYSCYGRSHDKSKSIQIGDYPNPHEIAEWMEGFNG